MEKILILYPFYQWQHRGSERQSDLLKVTQLVTDEPRTQIHILEVLNIMPSKFYIVIDFRDHREYHLWPTFLYTLNW